MRTRRRAIDPAYRPEVHAIVLEAGRRGASVISMANACGVTRRLLYFWRDQYPEFAVTLDMARQHAQEHWENVGFRNLDNPAFKERVWWLRLQRFSDYRQSHKLVEHKHKDAITIERVVMTGQRPRTQ